MNEFGYKNNSDSENIYFNTTGKKQILEIESTIKTLLTQKLDLIAQQKTKHKILCVGCQKKVLLTKCKFVHQMYCEDEPYTGPQWFHSGTCYIICSCNTANRFYDKETTAILEKQIYAQRGRLYSKEVEWDK